MDGIFAKIDAGVPLTGGDGLLGGMLKAALERGLETELTEHVGYERGAPDASAFPNSRNGASSKTVATEIGDIELAVPRDRDGTFTPMLVPKGARRLDGLDGVIISLYAGGMTVRDIQHHLASTIGTELSHETISKITDQIAEEVLAWQTRPLEALYPVIYLDAIVVKIRDGAHVQNKAAHIAVGVDMDGIKHVRGIWVQATEGAKFWAGVCAELANRGVRDVLIVCCDGLTGFPDAVAATWPHATVQTCVVHLIRAATRFVNYQDRKAVAAALRPIYTAVNEDAALEALDAFETSPLGRRYPSAVKTFHDAWDRFIPFLAFPPELRRVIYTTNSIESLNYQLRKVTKNWGHFPKTWPRSSCCGWRSATSRTSAPGIAPRNAGSRPTNAKPRDDSWKARSPRTGNEPSNSSPWPTPTASTPTSERSEPMTTIDTGHQASEGLLVSARDLLREIETVLIHTGPETNHEITRILTEQAGNHGGHGNLIDQVQLRVHAIDDHLNNH